MSIRRSPERRPARTRPASWLLAGALLAGVLQGCVPLAATGLAVGGMSALDRRTLGAQTDDQAIEFRAGSQLRQAGERMRGVSVTSYNGKVLISGQVPNDAAKADAERIIASVANVRSVHNELAVGPRPAVATSVTDATLTARIKASLVEARDLQAQSIKVISEYGEVYLMGMVTRREGDRAAQVAAGVAGVRRVVTAFEYLSEDELARIQRRPAGGEPAK